MIDVYMTPPPVFWQEALEKIRAGDSVKGNSIPNYASEEKRSVGFVAERVVHHWLQHEQIEHTWNGGQDLLPDFVINGHTVSVRTVTRSFLFAFTKQLRDTSADNLLFTRYTGKNLDGSEGLIIVIGGITRSKFCDDTITVARPKGYVVEPGFIAADEMRVAEGFGCLTPPNQWIREITQ